MEKNEGRENKMHGFHLFINAMYLIAPIIFLRIAILPRFNLGFLDIAGVVFLLNGFLICIGYLLFGIPCAFRFYASEGDEAIRDAKIFMAIGVLSLVLGRFFFVSMENTVLHPYPYR
jgi:hypothetical protein